MPFHCISLAEPNLFLIHQLKNHLQEIELITQGTHHFTSTFKFLEFLVRDMMSITESDRQMTLCVCVCVCARGLLQERAASHQAAHLCPHLLSVPRLQKHPRHGRAGTQSALDVVPGQLPPAMRFHEGFLRLSMGGVANSSLPRWQDAMIIN